MIQTADIGEVLFDPFPTMAGHFGLCRGAFIARVGNYTTYNTLIFTRGLWTLLQENVDYFFFSKIRVVCVFDLPFRLQDSILFLAEICTYYVKFKLSWAVANCTVPIDNNFGLLYLRESLVNMITLRRYD